MINSVFFVILGLVVSTMAAPHGVGLGAVQTTYTTHPVGSWPAVPTLLSAAVPPLLPKVRVASTDYHVVQPQVELEPDVNVHLTAPAEVRVHRPKYHVTQPKVHVTKPEIHVSQPDVHVVRPEVRVARPKVHVHQPQVHVTKPEVHVSRPEYHVVENADVSVSEGETHYVHQAPTVHVDGSEPEVHLTRSHYSVNSAPSVTYHDAAPVHTVAEVPTAITYQDTAVNSVAAVPTYQDTAVHTVAAAVPTAAVVPTTVNRYHHHGKSIF